MLATCRDQTSKLLVTSLNHYTTPSPPKKEEPRLLRASVLLLRLSGRKWCQFSVCISSLHRQPSCFNAWNFVHAYKLQHLREMTHRDCSAFSEVEVYLNSMQAVTFWEYKEEEKISKHKKSPPDFTSPLWWVGEDVIFQMHFSNATYRSLL